jgi:hypothetical protein
MAMNGDLQGLSGPPGGEFRQLAAGMQDMKSALLAIPLETANLLEKAYLAVVRLGLCAERPCPSPNTASKRERKRKRDF